MTIEPGQILLHYQFVEKIGEGGMGVVWKAIDTTLDREVAIKVLPDVFSQDADRLARFEREAKLLASLSHVNIAAVFSVHQAEGLRFLAMELVDGEDLSQRLARGPIPVDEALVIARAVAEALEVAHDNGVIHRDLKPANIKLKSDGTVKVLDFGLAKALTSDPVTGGSDPTLSPTMTTAGTMPGVILGTAAYMSPEQARGRPVDRRADIWAFGCLLYQMLTARQPFSGETASDTLASVLKLEPGWGGLPADTPAAIRRLMRRCLTKDIDRRLSHISSARQEIREVLDGSGDLEELPDSAVPARSKTLWVTALPWALVGVLAVTAFFLWRAPPLPSNGAPRKPMTLAVPFPKGTAIPTFQMGALALSPTGQNLALVLTANGTQNLYVRNMQSADVTLFPETEGASTPFFSPDGEWVGFFMDNKLKKVSIEGGKPVTICDTEGQNRGASWGLDDRIVFAPHYTTGMMQVSGSGGEATPLTTLDQAGGERTHRWPQALTDRDVVLFTVGSADSPEGYDNARIDALRPGTGERITVFEGASAARYVDSGHLVLAREGFLFAVPFDVDTLTVQGPLVPVVENVMGSQSSGMVLADFSHTGLLAYVRGTPTTMQRRLVWRFRDRSSTPLSVPPGRLVGPRLSPDENRVALSIATGTNFDIWVYDLERENMTRLTFDGDNHTPVWSPDGRRIVFSSVRDNQLRSVYSVVSDGSAGAQLVYAADRRTDDGSAVPDSWSPDGRHVAMTTSGRNGNDIVMVSLEEDSVSAFLETPNNEDQADFSPDGRWIAYTSNETGRDEIYVRPFPGPGGRWQISVDGGMEPYWANDGQRVFFRTDTELLEVEVDTRGGFHATRPRILLDDLSSHILTRSYSVAPDGQRFLFLEDVGDDSAAQSVTVVVDWLDDLRRRMSGP